MPIRSAIRTTAAMARTTEKEQRRTMPAALLTIDDSPSPQTGMLTGFLGENGIPAVLFCRGDRLEQNLESIIHAAAQGFVIGNHAYSHRRASDLSFDEMTAEILKTEMLIESVYRQALKPRPVKYFRFPHMDRGCGGWVVDYDAAPKQKATLVSLFTDGLNITLDPPSAAQIEKKQQLQDWLWREGFSPLPCGGVTFPWYKETEMAQAADAMFTYSTSDWMLTDRHRGKRVYKTLDDLKRKVADDPWLKQKDSAHIILAHDQDGLFPVVRELAVFLQESAGMVFRAAG